MPRDKQMSFNIIGTGSALPSREVTNDELTRYFETSDEWIRTRTGICSRRVITDETLLSLAAKASENALDNAGISPDNIDAVIVTTLRGDLISPSLSSLLAGKLEIPTSRVFDVNMGCPGFIYGLDLCDALISSGKAKRVLCTSAESMTRLSDWSDRSSAILFGDGAGAVIAEAGEGLIELHTTLKSSAEHLYVGRNKSTSPFDVTERLEPFVKMNGQEIYRFAVETVWSELSSMLERNSLNTSDIKAFILHQANMRIINAIRTRSGAEESRFPHNIERTGNTSSASVPILLDEVNRSGGLSDGDLIIMSAFGSGLSTATALLKWKAIGNTGEGAV